MALIAVSLIPDISCVIARVPSYYVSEGSAGKGTGSVSVRPLYSSSKRNPNGIRIRFRRSRDTVFPDIILI